MPITTNQPSRLKDFRTLWPVLLLIVLGVAGRFVPHLPNFTPIAAIALFGGLYLPKRWAVVLPLLAMFVSDIFIGFYSWPVMLSVYASFALVGLIGLTVRKNIKFHRILGGTLLGSILFFVITNWAVWMFGTMYARDLTGLLQSYYMALPFFRNSLLGDIFFTTVLVGGMEVVLRLKSQIPMTKFDI